MIFKHSKEYSKDGKSKVSELNHLSGMSPKTTDLDMIEKLDIGESRWHSRADRYQYPYKWPKTTWVPTFGPQNHEKLRCSSLKYGLYPLNMMVVGSHGSSWGHFTPIKWRYTGPNLQLVLFCAPLPRASDASIGHLGGLNHPLESTIFPS